MANQVRRLREELEMSQAEFATALKCTVGCVSNYERNTRDPSIEVAYQMIDLAQTKGITKILEDIFPEADQRSLPETQPEIEQYMSEEQEFIRCYELEKNLTSSLNIQKFKIALFQAILEACQTESLEEVGEVINEMITEFSILVHKAKNIGE